VYIIYIKQGDRDMKVNVVTIGKDCKVQITSGNQVIFERMFFDWTFDQIWDEISDCGQKIWIETQLEFAN
jgi:hypothetical protein